VPYAAGQTYRQKYPDSRTITLMMWTAGINQTSGNPDPTNQLLTWNNNYQQLRAAFWVRNANGSAQAPLVRQWSLGTGTLVSATAMAEIAGTMEPTMTGRTRADFQVDLLLADPYFYGASQNQTLAYNTVTAVTNLGEGVVAEGSGGTFTIQLNGPLTNPTLTNSTTGVSVTYGATIASGHYVLVDTVGFSALTDAAANVIAQISHAGARRWMVLASGSNSLKLTSTNGGDTGTAALVWTPPYL
jgi:hypothetical protein